MDSDYNDEYYHQLQFINKKLKQTPEGPEREELNSLRQNIEELISLTAQPGTSGRCSNQSYENFSASKNSYNRAANIDDNIDDEYALFMAELAKEEAFEASNSLNKNPKTNEINKFKDLEGKKFRAPFQHQWGQMSYHNAMICSVVEGFSDLTQLKVKVLFLNPIHKEMLPCPYFFDVEKDCHFSDDKCGYSHGELIDYSSLQPYVEPNFEDITIGDEVLAKQDDSLWYRGKVTKILDGQCVIKFTQKHDSAKIKFEHILPLEKSKSESEEDSEKEGDTQEIENDANEKMRKKQEERRRQEKLINSTLMTSNADRLGDWEKHTKGIGSKLMQKMGYIVGSGLGKDSDGITKPVSAVVLPQGKSLDFCMNLKESSNNPDLFDADNVSQMSLNRKGKKKAKAIQKSMVKNKIKQVDKIEKMDLDMYITWQFNRGNLLPYEEKESKILRDKFKGASDGEMNVVNFRIDERIKKSLKEIERLKARVQDLDIKQKHLKKAHFRLKGWNQLIERLNIYKQLIENEIGRRKNNKEMSTF